MYHYDKNNYYRSTYLSILIRCDKGIRSKLTEQKLNFFVFIYNDKYSSDVFGSCTNSYSIFFLMLADMTMCFFFFNFDVPGYRSGFFNYYSKSVVPILTI